MKLSSRTAAPTITVDEARAMVAPAVNVLAWVSRATVFPDDSQRSLDTAFQIIQDLLECMAFHHHAVITMPSPSLYELHYEVAAQPLEESAVITFRVVFCVQP